MSAYFAAPAVALAVALCLSWILAGSRARRIALDRPNARSLHRDPIPRTGGLAIVAGLIAGWLVLDAGSFRILPGAVLALAALSFVDDLRSLPAWVRLLAHLAVAAVLVVTMAPAMPLLLMIGAVIAIAWMINLYNFMDGSDGLAGGMAVLGFAFYGWAALKSGNTTFAWTNWTVSAAAAGFLAFNFHPARIFMGDSGSVPLGLLAGGLGMLGWTQGDWPVWFPALVFSPFIVDATVTLARRLWQRERVWQAHREHYYQRLVQLGWGHRRTALVEYAVMVLCGGAAIFALDLSNDAQSMVLGAAALLYMFAMLAVDAAWRTSAGAAP